MPRQECAGILYAIDSLNHRLSEVPENVKDAETPCMELTPVLDDTQYSLDDVGRAHARLESGKAMGKVVVQN